MEKIKSIAFDLEGTIIDVEHAHHQAHLFAARDIGVELTVEECFEKIPHFIGGPDDEVAKDICKLASLQGTQVDYQDVHTAKKKHYQLILPELTIKPRDGFDQFFSAIKKQGIKYTIGSLTNEEQARILLEKSGLANLFGYQNIVLRENVINPKPAPDVWIETAQRAGVQPSQQIVFEDSPRGIQGAISVGAYCVGMPVYNRKDTIIALAEAGAKRFFMSWEEINPDPLLRNINQEYNS